MKRSLVTLIAALMIGCASKDTKNTSYSIGSKSNSIKYNSVVYTEQIQERINHWNFYYGSSFTLDKKVNNNLLEEIRINYNSKGKMPTLLEFGDNCITVTDYFNEYLFNGKEPEDIEEEVRADGDLSRTVFGI